MFFAEIRDLGRLIAYSENDGGRAGVAVVEQFKGYCVDNDLDEAKKLYFSKRYIKYHMDDIFREVCINKNTNLETIKWLYSLGNIKASLCDLFLFACCYGRFETMNWLNTLNGINDHDRKIAFERACSANNFEVAKWLYSHITEDNTSVSYSCHVFFSMCQQNNIQGAKLIYSLNPKKIYVLEEFFFDACRNRNLELAKWLYTINQSDNKTGTIIHIQYNGIYHYNKIDINYNDKIHFKIRDLKCDYSNLFVNSYESGRFDICNLLIDCNLDHLYKYYRYVHSNKLEKSHIVKNHIKNHISDVLWKNRKDAIMLNFFYSNNCLV